MEKQVKRIPGPAESAALFLFCLLFYLSFVFFDGVKLYPDSVSYLSADSSREALYPLFLRACAALARITEKFSGKEGTQALFPGFPDAALYLAVILQSFLSAFAAWKTGRFYAKLSGNRVVCRVMLYLGAAAVCFTALLNRFAAARASAYHTCILTESVSYPLVILFMTALCEYLRSFRKKEAARCLAILLLVLLLRKQLMVCLLVFASAGFVTACLRRHSLKKGGMILLAAAAVYTAAFLLEGLYHQSVHGRFMQHTGGSEGLCCTLLYVSDEEDEGRFEDAELAEAFRAIHRKAEEQGLLYTTLEDGPGGKVSAMERTTHYADSYDEIGYHIVHPVLQALILEEDPERDGIEQKILLDRYESGLNRALLFSHPDRYFRLWRMNFVKGAVNSVLRYHRLLNAAAAVLYALYLFLLCWLSRRRKAADLCLAGALILWMILLNSAVVSAVIFPQPRYMTYMMPLFFSELAALFMEAGMKK